MLVPHHHLVGNESCYTCKGGCESQAPGLVDFNFQNVGSSKSSNFLLISNLYKYVTHEIINLSIRTHLIVFASTFTFNILFNFVFLSNISF